MLATKLKIMVPKQTNKKQTNKNNFLAISYVKWSFSNFIQPITTSGVKFYSRGQSFCKVDFRSYL